MENVFKLVDRIVNDYFDKDMLYGGQEWRMDKGCDQKAWGFAGVIKSEEREEDSRI
jgi:hypothetical protein